MPIYIFPVAIHSTTSTIRTQSRLPILYPHSYQYQYYTHTVEITHNFHTQDTYVYPIVNFAKSLCVFRSNATHTFLKYSCISVFCNPHNNIMGLPRLNNTITRNNTIGKILCVFRLNVTHALKNSCISVFCNPHNNIMGLPRLNTRNNTIGKITSQRLQN